MSEKRYEIIEENYVGYYQGTAFLMSNGENEWYIWEKKEKAQELADLLNILNDDVKHLEEYCGDLEADVKRFEEENKRLKKLISDVEKSVGVRIDNLIDEEMIDDE